MTPKNVLRRRSVALCEKFGRQVDLRQARAHRVGLGIAFVIGKRKQSELPLKILRLILPVLAFLALATGAVASDEMRPWVWQGSTCANCAIAIVNDHHAELDSVDSQAFLRALESQKPTLMAMYGIDGQQYNFLAHMAVGILGRESHFFQSKRYWVKENFPWAIRVLKVVRVYLSNGNRRLTDSSRGPTQIKVIPGRIEQAYHFDESQLWVPENAAVATMGYLIETLYELQRRSVFQKLTFINKDNYVDYLPYLYFGSPKTLLSGKANPDHNLYVQDMKRYMSWVQIYEIAPAAPSTQLH